LATSKSEQKEKISKDYETQLFKQKNSLEKKCMKDVMDAKEDYLKKYESDIAQFTSHINEKIVADSFILKN
jgi:primosomal protein N''